MKIKRLFFVSVVLLLIGGVGFGLLLARPRSDQVAQRFSFIEARQQIQRIDVVLNRSTVVQFDVNLGRVSVSEPKIAEAVIISPTQLLVNGKTIGTCSLLAWSVNDQDHPVNFTVGVMADIESIRQELTVLYPKEPIELKQIDGKAVLSGIVASKAVVDGAAAVTEGVGLKVVNLLRVSAVGPAQQVMLQVRVAEVSRVVLRQLGVNFFRIVGQARGTVGPNLFNPPVGVLRDPELGTPGQNFTFSDAVNLFLFNPSSGIGSFIRALQSRNAFRSLAEPNLIAADGQKGSFLAGGEFPFPVVQGAGVNLALTIIFREFGVRLDFVPTIVDEKHIRLELAPEVSALDFSNGINISGFRIPGLTSRKAKTTLELADGQSFALAGLLSNDLTKVNAKMPVLGDLPILGYLFKSERYQRNETELVFLCTVRLVKPLNPEEVPNLPGVDQFKKDEGLEGEFGHKAPPAMPAKPPEKPSNGLGGSGGY